MTIRSVQTWKREQKELDLGMFSYLYSKRSEMIPENTLNPHTQKNTSWDVLYSKKIYNNPREYFKPTQKIHQQSSQQLLKSFLCIHNLIWNNHPMVSYMQIIQ